MTNQTSSAGPVLLVHGGAWSIPDNLVEAHLSGIRKAMVAGWKKIELGGSAMDAVEAAVIVLEDDDTFDAGRGSFLIRDGRVQCDALMMDGATLRAGGVGCVERIRNPISAAKKVLQESPHVYFVAEGAERFAAEHGMELIDNSELVVERELEHLRQAQQKAAQGQPHELVAGGHDTPAAVALDIHRSLAAAA